MVGGGVEGRIAVATAVASAAFIVGTGAGFDAVLIIRRRRRRCCERSFPPLFLFCFVWFRFVLFFSATLSVFMFEITSSGYGRERVGLT